MYAIYNDNLKAFLPPVNLRGAWAHVEPSSVPRIFTKRNDARASLRSWLKGPTECIQHGEIQRPRPNPQSWRVVPVRVEIIDGD